MPTASPRDTSLLTTARVDLRDNDVALGVSGNHAENLKAIERRLGVRVGQRGTELHLSGPADAVASAVRLVEQLETILRAGQPVGREDVEQGLKMLGRGSSPEQGLDSLVLGPVLSRAGRHVAPKSLAQKRYVDAIRRHDIVFGIGPAGTGKTYLAMAMAVAALQARSVKRIILARPAVEAGEKLGFLPGDLAEKVNPYLRPLYDALHDMMDASRAAQLVEQGTVEVAPLAFMRGRTLNDAFVILDGVEGIGFCTFSEVDVVRHPLVQEVIRAYDRSEAEARAAEAARTESAQPSAPEPGRTDADTGAGQGGQN